MKDTNGDESGETITGQGYDEVRGVYTAAHQSTPVVVISIINSDAVLLPFHPNILKIIVTLLVTWCCYFVNAHILNVQYHQVLLPLDYATSLDLITDDELSAGLQRIAPTCKTFILMDCCHSGSICDLP